MFLTTTTAFTITELGYTIPANTTDFAILNQFTPEQIASASSLTTAILAGTVVWKRTAGGAVETPADYDPDYALISALTTGTGAARDKLSKGQFTAGSILFSDATGVYAENNGKLFFDATNFRLGIGTNAPTRDLDVNGVAAIRSQLLVGSTNPVDITGTSVFPPFQIQGISATQMAAIQYSNDINPPAFNLLKSRGATLGAQAIVANADEIGRLQFRASDGVNFQAAASVRAAVDAAPAANSMPGRLGFFTTPTGSVTPLERMRIDKDGNTTLSNSGMLVNIPAAPLNLVANVAATLGTQLNLVNKGGGGGAGSAIDFHTYDDQPTSTQPGARIGAVDDNFSAYLAFFTKVPGGPANAIAERMRITSDGRVGIGGTPVATAALQIDSTTQGFLLPRMTSAQRLAIATPPAGLMVYDTNLGCRSIYAGTHWTFEYDTATTAIQTTTSNVYSNIAELTTPSLEAGLYVIRMRGIMQSTVITTGVGLKILNGSATISELNINWTFSQAGNGTDKNYEYTQLAVGDNVASTGVVTANANLPVAGDGVVRISAAGTIIVQFRSEVNGSGVSIRPNSSLILRKVSA